MTVTGLLPATPQLPTGAIAISGEMRRLSCDQALQLADALLLVVMRIDDAADQRSNTTHDRGS